MAANGMMVFDIWGVDTRMDGWLKVWSIMYPTEESKKAVTWMREWISGEKRAWPEGMQSVVGGGSENAAGAAALNNN